MTVRSDTGPFALVPEWVFNVRLSSRAIHLYGLLSRYADRQGEAWPSRPTLAERLGCSMKSVDRTLAELKRVKAVSVRARKDEKGQHSNLYTVHRVPGEPVLSPPLPMGDAPPSVMGVAQKENQFEREPTTCEPSSRERKSRKPDPLWDAFVAVMGRQPATPSERGKWNRARKELADIGATASEVHQRAGAWKMKFPNAQVTPNALCSYWGFLGPRDLPAADHFVYEPEPEPDFKGNAASARAVLEGLRRG